MQFDALAVQAARGRGTQDLKLGELLLRLFDGDLLLRLGFARQVDYIRERLGVAPRSVYSWMKLARGLATCPALHQAVNAGLVTSRKALLLIDLPGDLPGDLLGTDADAWTARAIAMSCTELERCVREEGGFDTTTTEYEVDSIVFRMTPGQQDRLEAALNLARVVVGPAAPRWQLLEAIAMEYLGEHPGEFSAELSGESGGNSVQTQVGLPIPETCVPEACGAMPQSDLPTDPEELDRMARAILKERMVRDAEFGRSLLGVQRNREYLALGFDSFQSYVRDRLGITPRTARLRIWLEKRMEELPALREALADGRLTLEKARLIAKGATPFSIDSRIEDATSTTWQQVERDSTAEEDRKNRALGLRRIWGPSDAFAVLMDAIASAEAIAEDGFNPGECLARVSDHFVEVWTINLEKPKCTKARRTVFGRHHGLCGVPGCSAEAQHEHHLQFRSRGGGNEIENRVALCAAHHLRGVHAGYLTVEGRAGEHLVWRFGSKTSGETLGETLRETLRETWCTTGDNDVRREAVLEQTT